MTRVSLPQHCYEMWKHIRRDPKCKRKRCVYAIVLSKDVPAPYVSICVEDPSRGCMVGFRGVEPWRITGYHVARLGSAVVRCGKAELKIEPINCVAGQGHVIEPYSGPTDIAIRVWWDMCLKVSFDGKSYCICPQPAAQSQPQEKREGVREIVKRLVKRVYVYLTKRNARVKTGATAEGHTSSSP